MDSINNYITKYTKRLACQIIDTQDRFIYKQILADMKQNPDKYPFDELIIIERERIVDLINKGLAFEKMQAQKE